jgi:hypothetical protein
MIEAISSFRSVQKKHLAAPLLAERELYLGHLLRQGIGRMLVRSTAIYLIHIIRILNLKVLRSVGEAEFWKLESFGSTIKGHTEKSSALAGLHEPS